MLVRVATFLVSTVLLIGCAASGTSEGYETGVLVITRAEANPVSPESPCGWIYAFDQPNGRPDLCVFIWPNGTWTLGAESTRGYYGDVLSSGSLENGVALGFPVEDCNRQATCMLPDVCPPG